MSAGAVSATINIGAYAALTTLSPWLDAHRIVALAGGVALGAGVNFALARAWVFTGTVPGRRRKEAETMTHRKGPVGL